MLQIGGDTAACADRPRYSLERFGAGTGGWSGRSSLAAQRGLLGAFPSIFSFSRRPPGHAVRFRGRRSAIFLLFSVGPLHLVVFFSRLDSVSESLADWSAPAIPSPLPPDGRRWSSPSSSRRCPVLRGDRSGAASMCVRARRGRVSDSNFTSG